MRLWSWILVVYFVHGGNISVYRQYGYAHAYECWAAFDAIGAYTHAAKAICVQER